MAKPRKTIPLARKRDILLVAALLALAAGLWFLLRPVGAAQGAVARVEVFRGEASVREIPLAEDGFYEIEGALLPVHLEVAEGSIRFVHSECPDHVCEREGWLRREGEQAVCVPAGVSITVRED